MSLWSLYLLKTVFMPVRYFSSIFSHAFIITGAKSSSRLSLGGGSLFSSGSPSPSPSLASSLASSAGGAGSFLSSFLKKSSSLFSSFWPSSPSPSPSAAASASARALASSSALIHSSSSFRSRSSSAFFSMISFLTPSRSWFQSFCLRVKMCSRTWEMSSVTDGTS